MAKFHTAELLKEIDARRTRAAKLVAEAGRVRVEMAAIEGELAAIGIQVGQATEPEPARTPVPRQPRARNTVTLADALAMAIEVRAVVSPAEAARLVQSNGYQSTAQNFAIVVASMLSKDARFRRVGRGRYERVE